MRNKRHYLRLLDDNPTAGVGFTLAASAVYAARYGACEAEHHSTAEWKQIARRLKADYGEQLTTDQVRAEMKAEDDQARDFTLRVRLTDAEREQLQTYADAETGGNVSEYIRRKLLP